MDGLIPGADDLVPGMDGLIGIVAWAILASAWALNVGTLKRQSRFGMPRRPRGRLIAVSTLILTPVAACFGTWVIPAIIGALGAGMLLVVRDRETRLKRGSNLRAAADGPGRGGLRQ